MIVLVRHMIAVSLDVLECNDHSYYLITHVPSLSRLHHSNFHHVARATKKSKYILGRGHQRKPFTNGSVYNAISHRFHNLNVILSSCTALSVRDRHAMAKPHVPNTTHACH
jgi:hypothetical protein